MNLRILVSAVITYLYNEMVGHFPCHWVRRVYLKGALGSIGAKTYVQLRCRFFSPHRVQLGARNVINYGCLFDARNQMIVTGDNVSIGPEATILTLGHDPRSPEFADKGADVVIGDRVWIGYRAVILPGVTLGEGCVVGAGAVVTRSVEPFAIVAGNPARKIGERPRELTYRLDFAPPLI